MTNIVGTIAVVLVTNITQIGTFHSDKWGEFDVKEHRLQTNTVLMVEWEGNLRQFILKSADGPVLKEERTPKAWSAEGWHTNQNVILFTNVILPFTLTNTFWPGDIIATNVIAPESTGLSNILGILKSELL